MDPDMVAKRIEEAVVEYMSEDDDDFHEFNVGEYYPHTIGKCPLRYYHVYRMGEKPKLTGRSLNYVTVGKIAHTIIQGALSRLGYEIEKEFELRIDDFVIKGRADAVYMGLPTHVIEIKTTRDFPQDIYPDHRYQAHIYMKAFSAEYAVFIYVRRDDFSRRYYYLPFDEKVYNEAIEWVRNLHRSLVNGTPPQPKPLADYECNTCPLRDSCPRFRSILSYV